MFCLFLITLHIPNLKHYYMLISYLINRGLSHFVFKFLKGGGFVTTGTRTICCCYLGCMVHPHLHVLWRASFPALMTQSNLHKFLFLSTDSAITDNKPVIVFSLLFLVLSFMSNVLVIKSDQMLTSFVKIILMCWFSVNTEACFFFFP